MSLEEALSRRRSVRELAPIPLSAEALSQLLWAAQGITSEESDRTAPSAGGLFPLELHVATEEGLFRYRPLPHALEKISRRDSRREIFRAGLEQEALIDPAAVFVISGVVRRTQSKYGKRRSPRYVHLEAGHAAQNLLLQAVSLELGAVVIGAFEDDEIREALALPADHQPLYLIPVGTPRD
jgi:SagB-type dehydrogenase family enzyme